MTTPKNPIQDEHSVVTTSRNKRRTGRLLLIGGPFLVGLISVYLYMTGGRFVKTENAYIQADKVVVSSEVAGPISAVKVIENSHVDEGQPLFIIDDRSYAIALEQARASLQGVKAEIAMLKAGFHQKQHEFRLAQMNTDFAKREYHRQSNLEKYKAVAEAMLDQARHDLEVSGQRAEIVQDEMEQILARLDGDPEADVERQASYRLAKADVERAELNLARTVVQAPFAGWVSKVPQAGRYVDVGSTVMSLIADNTFWVEANFKETELTHVLLGQKAVIEVDAYPEQEWQGSVTSISPGTGSEYSIIPAQNASGNWVKVVQRVPVRIRVETDQDGPRLLAGMSTSVRVDTGYHRPLPFFVQRALSAIGMGRTAWAN